MRSSFRRSLFASLVALAFAAFAVLTGTPAHAATVSWLGGRSFWDIVTNWSSNPALPGVGDDVVINVAGAQTVTAKPLRAARLLIVATRGVGAASSAGSRRRVRAKGPRKLLPNCNSKPSTVVNRRGGAITPALLSSMSTGVLSAIRLKAPLESASTPLTVSVPPPLKPAVLERTVVVVPPPSRNDWPV